MSLEVRSVDAARTALGMEPNNPSNTTSSRKDGNMRHTIVKLGGSVLRGPSDAPAVKSILKEYQGPLVVVVSALKGVTDELVAASKLPASRNEAFIGKLRARHREFAAAFAAPDGAAGPSAAQIGAAFIRLDELLEELAGLLSCPASRSDRSVRVISMGERLSAVCVAVAAASIGRPAPVIEPGKLGLRATGSDHDARADIEASAPAIRSALEELDLAVVPGFYGLARDGRPMLFGRGGSDYSAAVIAACLRARSCDLVKDVGGIFDDDPERSASARPIPELGYGEAASLAAAGAKVLHPDCVSPLAAASVPLRVRGASLAAGMTVVGRRGGIGSAGGAAALAGEAGMA